MLLLLPFAMVPPAWRLPLLVWLTSPGPVLFRHQRIGANGVPFSMLKFRTMYADSSGLDGYLQLENHFEDDPLARVEWEASFKLRRDPRVTRFGSWLRRYSLDELPQLLNVLAGDMSLVGPRPIVAAEAGKYGMSFARYCSVKPGMTGPVAGLRPLRTDLRTARRARLPLCSLLVPVAGPRHPAPHRQSGHPSRRRLLRKHLVQRSA